MRLLVTGGAGFIGSNFVRKVLESHPDYEIKVLDKLTYAGRLENLNDVIDKIEFLQGDICVKEDVDKAMEHCDVVVHFAAETHVDRSIADPCSFLKTNVMGTYILLEAARSHDLERFIQIGTDEVYGSCISGAFSEDSLLRPSSPYSASKASADLLANAYFTTYALPISITRSSNNFGPYQYPEKLIPFFILKARRGEHLPIYGSGQNIRDWLYVYDNCTAIDLVLHKGKPGEIYNIGGGNELSNLDIANRILSKLDKPLDMIEHVDDRPGHDFRYSIDSSKVRQLGWRPKMNFEEAMDLTIEWYLRNDDWMKMVLS